jgi:hypothetical protein
MPAITPIENVSRKLASTSNGAETFGSNSDRRIRVRDSPSASAAETKSRSTTETVEPRTTQGEDDRREGKDDVHRSHQHVVELAPVVRSDQADDRAEHQRERGGENRADQDRLSPVEKAGPDVEAELAGTEA